MKKDTFMKISFESDNVQLQLNTSRDNCVLTYEMDGVKESYLRDILFFSWTCISDIHLLIKY